ncbi:hypothetical protein A0H81_07064 [Grifola frondosa]|uniref:Uncharacterized protein n=1 Tax=Grifola frondosa TaxID=5627 RepID=A0A1C7M8D8_GRIFR|nr:hypothetical protein A0H81_07064 [Grifola frondosa]
METTTDEVARMMFEVNFWGAANVIREELDPAWNIQASISHSSWDETSEPLAIIRSLSFNLVFSIRMPSLSKSMIETPIYPAYTNSALPSVALHHAVQTSRATLYDHIGYLEKAATALYTLSEMHNLPLRLLPGKDSVGLAGEKIG